MRHFALLGLAHVPLHARAMLACSVRFPQPLVPTGSPVVGTLGQASKDEMPSSSSSVIDLRDRGRVYAAGLVQGAQAPGATPAGVTLELGTEVAWTLRARRFT